MILTSHNLGIGYSGSTIVQNINLSLEKGSRTLIIAENGEGKTTLLKTLAGLHPRISGEISSPPREKMSWAHGKERGFFPHLTGLENLLFFKNMENISSAECELRLQDFREVPVLRKCLETSFSECSSGMKQILFLVNSLIGDKELVFWDEPMKSLSEENRTALLSLLPRTCSQKTLVIADHSSALWKNTCGTIFQIKQGEMHEL